ncbi:MAG: type VI secretion system-associated FHA domain protein TagH [Pseudomonadota bacterium]|nr:type VI secretion system-associated FHA domain protein TagH [Pseudomonadota bacterium]
MDLTLSVIRFENAPSAQGAVARLSAQGGTIGRKPDNDLVLPDPERWISGRHGEIHYRDGAFFLTDTSKNGTFVNHASAPLRNGQEIQLHDGDELSIGAYEIRVAVSAAEPQTPMPFDPFARGKSEHGPLPGTDTGAAAPDILSLVGEGADREEPAPQAPSADEWSPQEPEDWLGLEPPLEPPRKPGAEPVPPEESAPLAQPDHTPHENAFFRPPDAVPEDYDIWADEAQPKLATSEFEPSESDRETAEPLRQAAPLGAEPPQASAPSAEKVPMQRIQGAEGDGNLLQSFLTGLGAGEAPASPEAQTELVRCAGELLHAMTEGLMTVMMARAKFKSELRLEMTTIRAAENNPFKFSVDSEDALAHLLFRRSRGFLPPVEAAHEAFDDIQAHEMAMIAGLRAALRALLGRFEPTKLEQRFRNGSVLDRVAMARKAKYWDLFTEVYEEVAADATEDFLHLFGDAFTRAYEDQVFRLKESRRARQR